MAKVKLERLPPAHLTKGKAPAGYCKWCWKVTDLPSPESLNLSELEIALDFPEDTDLLDPQGLPDPVPDDKDLGSVEHVGGKVLVKRTLGRKDDEIRICIVAKCDAQRNGEISLQAKLGDTWKGLPIDEQKFDDPDCGKKRNRVIPAPIKP
jgi:hypothetical protein